jgi:TrmH family RNA methyltransferase
VARLSGRSARQRAGRFLVEGPQGVREAVRAGAVVQLYVTERAAERHAELVAQAGRGRIPVQLVTDAVLAAMAGDDATVHPQGLLAVCPLLVADLAGVLVQRPRLVAVLAQVRDPGNAGTVIRAADAAGADAVVLTDSSVDVHNPKCVRSTAGSLFHLPVITGVRLADAVQALHSAGLAVLAADGSGGTDLDDLADAADAARRGSAEPPAGPAGPPPGPAVLRGPVAWIFGNEAWGLPEADRELADAVVRVPVHGQAESLNLATAATVCLYATARAHRP